MVELARRWRLSDQRIRTKLALILVLPGLAIVTLAGLSVVSTTSDATSDEQARQLVVLGARTAELTERLQNERAAVALVFAAGTATGPVDDYRRQFSATDTVIHQFRAQSQRTAAPKLFPSALSRIDDECADLRSIRQQVLSGPGSTASAVTFRYRVIIADLLRFRQALSQVDGATGIAGRLRAAAALGDAAEALGLVQTTMVRSLTDGRIASAAQTEIIAADTRFTGAVEEFRGLAPAAWISRYEQVLSDPEVLTAERLYRIVVQVQPGPLPALGTDAKGWVTAAGTRIRLLHAVQAEVDAHLVAEIEQQRDWARHRVGVLTAGVGVALLCMVALGVVVARDLTRSLTGLRATAEDIAHTRLPEMVAQVSAGVVDLDRTRLLVAEIAEPIPVLGQDEVGQVAAAFNAVTASAVRLAGEQAALRGGVRAIFNSLSRRSQRRLNTVMTSIDLLQAKETDPDHLALLFQLDHAATGLRRLTAGLQVLAGGRAGLARPQPMALAAVLRAALSEIDQYQRVDLGMVDSDLQLHGETVEEVIHLLAELLDNAARFSAPSTLVVVDGRRVGDLLHIQVTDEGKGMTGAQLAAARDRIANPHRLDHHTAQQMGLPVVAAIADRLGISVQLRPTKPQGTRVDLTLPSTLFKTAPIGALDSGSAELPTAGAGWPALSAPATVPTVPPAPPRSKPEPELSSRPGPEPGPKAESESKSKAKADLGAPTVELAKLGSGWQSASSWPSPAPTVQPPTEPPHPEPPHPEPARPEPPHPEPAHPEPAHPEPTPEIYQQLKHAWFGGSAGALGQAASRAAASATEPTEFTDSGLPQRRRTTARTPATDPGLDRASGSATPGPAPSLAEQRSTRDPDQLRRRYASLDRSLAATRRRPAPSDHQEEQQP